MSNELEEPSGTETNSIEIYSGNRRVISSGTVIAPSQDPIRFVFGPKEDRLTIILKFIDDEGKDQRIDAKNVDDKSLEFILQNFSNTFGSYSLKPIYIADLSGCHMFFSFFVIGHQEGKMKTLHYTFYLGDSDKTVDDAEVDSK